ncbi:MAG: CHAT domain-containing protein [Cyanobacteria bacterium P01_A01_bin.114]
MRTVFELKVISQDQDACFLLLFWDNRSLTARLPYPSKLHKRYQRWQNRYLKFYQLADSSEGVRASGRLNPGSGDPAHDLQEAERTWIDEFNRWLGDAEDRKVQQCIQDEITRLFQERAHSTNLPMEGAGVDMGVNTGVDIYVACDAPMLEKLPWEAWDLAPRNAFPGTVRIIRTAVSETVGTVAARPQSARKPRILAVLATDPDLPLQKDWQILRSLAPLTDLRRFTYPQNADPAAIKQQLAKTLAEPPGWDVLFFAGHSDETALTGGRFALTPDCQLSVSELEENLIQARENGLQLAIFNSCSGLSLAQSLVGLGLQVLVMREPIRNDVAQRFLTPLCRALAERQDIADALQSAYQYLQMAERLAYPSAYLLPLLFSPKQASFYRLTTVSWQQQIQRWIPTRRELVTVGLLIGLNFFIDVHEVLFDVRTWVQARYRQATHQLASDQLPPVLLIEVDELSLKAYQETQEFRMDAFQERDIDHQYLGQLLTQILALEIPVVGIQYSLSTNQSNDRLPDLVKTAVQTQSTWFVFDDKSLNTIANPQWSLRGNSRVPRGWRLARPDAYPCDERDCRFAYQLALAGQLHALQREDSTLTYTPMPAAESAQPLQARVSQSLKNIDPAFLRQHLPWAQSTWLPVMMDLSLPPNQIYQRVSAQKLLSPASQTAVSQETRDQPIALIAAGTYERNLDKQAAPLAYLFWCRQGQVLNTFAIDLEGCDRNITHGQFNAYMVHHWLNHHHVSKIPDWWMILIAALAGKGFSIHQQGLPSDRRVLNRRYGVGLTFLFGLFSLQIYVSFLLLIPWFFTSLTFWLYLRPPRSR